MTGYRYDPDALARTAALIYAHLPEHLKSVDRQALAAIPPEEAELASFVEILAAPLAATRQSVEELYGDLFVDTAGDAMLARLAESIGLALVFRDPDANRRDLKGAVARRRRKGTPSMLEEMARSLAGRLVASVEGWRLVQMTQDLNLVRAERTLPDILKPSIAEGVAGPMETVPRAVDPRPMSARSGRVHPRHMAHWVHLGQMFPVAGAHPHRLPDGAADLRFAFDAGNAWQALRARPTGIEDALRTDRVPERLFAEDPGAWFGREGRFAVRIAGLPAAAAAEPALRSAAAVLPDGDAFLRGTPALELIDYDGARTSGAVEIALMAAPLSSGSPDPTAATRQTGLVVDLSGVTGTLAATGPVAADALAMLRLSPGAGAVSRHFAGGVVLATGGTVRAWRASPAAALAEEGYLAGALYLRLPSLRLTGEHWFYIGADGALHRASADGGPGIDLPPAAGNAPPERALASAPVGPVWPEAPSSAERLPFAPALPAPGAAPVAMHGLRALRPTGLSPLPAGERSALVLALTYFALGRRFEPVLRLVWDGGDPAASDWEALDAGAEPLIGDPAPRFGTLAELLTQGRTDLALALRFESERAGAILTPGELSVTGFDGRSVLVSLPEFVADDAAPASWPAGPAPVAAVSTALQVGRDGSTWVAGTNICRRRALGPAAPLDGPVAMRRRQLHGRRLCAWQNESGPDVLDPAIPGRLEIDARFGLFAIAATEVPRPHPPGPLAAAPVVTVDFQAGATMAIGAIPIDHDRALARAPETPTRIVSLSGRLAPGSDPALAGLPLHRSLADALTAIAATPALREVVRIEDSGFYPDETLDWPDGPDELALRAAAGTQPVVEVAGTPPGPARYGSLEITGLVLTAAGPLTLDLAPAQRVELNFVTLRREDLTLGLHLDEAEGAERAVLTRCITGPLSLPDPGELAISDSIIDAGAGGAAIAATRARLVMDRATVRGLIDVERVDMSDSLLTDPVTARERFAGCVRFSLLAPGGSTPSKHRVVRDATARFVSLDRRDPAYLRLAETNDPRIVTGASDGGEMGAFARAGIAEMMSALARRLAEHTPAGLRTGLIRRH